jgi:regulator of nonsense transcripts 2
MYLFSKIERVPIHVQFLISETFELIRPNLVRLSSYSAAVEELNRRILADRAMSIKEDVEEEPELNCSEAPPITFSPAIAVNEEEVELDIDGEIDDGDIDDDELDIEDDDMEEDDENEMQDDDDDADFEREFARLMHETLDCRRSERKVIPFDVSVPIRVKNVDSIEVPEGTVPFTLLTKKGNKQQVDIAANFRQKL